MDLLYNHKKASQIENGYVDMIKDLQGRTLPAFNFATQDYNPPSYIHCQKRSTNDVWKAALSSDRVQWIVRQIVREERRDYDDVVAEAEQILKELAYTDHMTVLRMLGFSLFLVLKSIYRDGVFVNKGALSNIQDLIKHHPVVFMPSHRSYMDFLLVSLICFYLQLPLPAIAAGMDFMGMKGVGAMLRACGAFFMRRSFGSDRLYWALFTEYVHTILINGDRPMEFFIEGTRSRTGKSLNPKFGLLSVIAEPYLKAQTYDVIVVPISISYDRLLEESLYAYELLGIPKPKESTSGLMKASSILKDNYGGVHMHFCEPLSMREYFGHLDRSIHACYPRYMLRLSSTEQKHMEILGYKILLEHQQNFVHTPWSVMAMVLSLYPKGISLDCLVDDMLWFQQILLKSNVKVKWPSGSMRETVYINLHRFQHIVKLQTCSEPQAVDMVWVAGSRRVHQKKRIPPSSQLDPSIIEETVNHIMLGNYRNQMLHHFVRPALISFSVQKLIGKNKGEKIANHLWFDDFKFLQDLLRKEFIFEPEKFEEDIESGIKFLQLCGVVSYYKSDSLYIKDHSQRVLSFLRSLFSVFVTTYWVCAQYLLSSTYSQTLKTLPHQIQHWISGQLQVEGMSQEMLSLNLISNALHSFINMKALTRIKMRNQKLVQVIIPSLWKISKRIESFIQVPRISTEKAFSKAANFTSKL